MGDHDKDPASLSALGSTFVPVLIYAGICLLIFFACRRTSTRTYAPRTIKQLREPEYVFSVMSYLPDLCTSVQRPVRLSAVLQMMQNDCIVPG